MEEFEAMQKEKIRNSHIGRKLKLGVHNKLESSVISLKLQPMHLLNLSLELPECIVRIAFGVQWLFPGIREPAGVGQW